MPYDVHVFDTAKKHKMTLTLSARHAHKLLGAPSNSIEWSKKGPRVVSCPKKQETLFLYRVLDSVGIVSVAAPTAFENASSFTEHAYHLNIFGLPTFKNMYLKFLKC